ncbi:unnamed protein product [Arctogadus glacialis]
MSEQIAPMTSTANTKRRKESPVQVRVYSASPDVSTPTDTPATTGGMPGGGGPPLSDASDPGCVHYNEKLEECLPTPRGIAVRPSSEQHLDAADQPNVGGEEWDWQGRSSNHSPPLCSQRDDDTALGCCSLLLL